MVNSTMIAARPISLSCYRTIVAGNGMTSAVPHHLAGPSSCRCYSISAGQRPARPSSSIARTAMINAANATAARPDLKRSKYDPALGARRMLTMKQTSPPQAATPATKETHPSSDALRNPEAVFSTTSKDWLLFHPVYTPQELDNVKVVHRESVTIGDQVAAAMVKVMRTMFDIVTRYPSHREKFPRIKGRSSDKVTLPSAAKVQSSIDALSQEASDKNTVGPTSSASIVKAKDASNAVEMGLEEMRKKGLTFGPEQWLIRIIFLESVAGVPGMAAAVCRHLHSLRLLRRDHGGWIRTMLEDAENERMHLLTFMKIAQPGILMRTMLLGAQGVFFNFFFVFYLLAPRVAHRFVGKLEEEAVYTYSAILEDMDAGRLPEWENYPAPKIAIDYWRLPKDAMLYDVMKAVRADEATHRFINHTYASLDQAKDYSPFMLGEPSAKMRGEKYGLEREEALAYLQQRRIDVETEAERIRVEKRKAALKNATHSKS